MLPRNNPGLTELAREVYPEDSVLVTENAASNSVCVEVNGEEMFTIKHDHAVVATAHLLGFLRLVRGL